MRISDHEIERSVLGQLMVFREHRQKALLLEVEDFDDREHKTIFAAILKQTQTDSNFDFLMLANTCGEDCREEITACVQLAVSAGLFDEHFALLKEMSERRRLTRGVNELCWSSEISTAALQKLVDEENGKKSITDLQQTNKENIDRFVAGLNKSDGVIMSGFGKIDRILGGIRKGTVFIVGARPSVGKTSFALNVAANQLADLDKKVMFFSLEMTAEMILERLMAAQQGIEYKRFSQNTLSEDEVKLITDSADRLKSEGRFTVLDEVYNAELICNLIRENRPDLAVVDFMQIISTTGKFENVRGRIDYISSLFKRTAKATDCVIMVLSQLTRAGKDAPTMSDLKESGGLEQDGDYIALLHRPYVLNKGDSSVTPEQTELLFDKNKFGNVGKIDLYFDLKHQRFYELDEWHESRIDRSGTAFEDDVQI